MTSWVLNDVSAISDQQGRQTAPFDQPLLVAWLLTLLFGTIMVFSASVDRFSQPDAMLWRHALYLGIAGGAFVITLGMPLKIWLWLRLPLLAIGLLMLVLVLFVGPVRNGATRWIPLGPFSLQASEIAKLVTVVYFAGFLAVTPVQKLANLRGLAMPVAVLGLLVFLLLCEPDFGNAAVICAVALCMMFVAGARLRYFFLMAVAGIGGFALLAVAAPYRLQRLMTFSDPWQEQFGAGYQLTQALIGFGRGEFFGLGLGQSIQKLEYLPEAHNDFLLAVIAEELGVFGVLLTLTLLTVVVWRMMRIAQLALLRADLLGRGLCVGGAVLLSLQTLISAGVNMGVLPTKGLTLPFISFGGNSLIVCCVLVALALRVDFEARLNESAGAQS